MKHYQKFQLQTLLVAVAFILGTLVGIKFFSPLATVLCTASIAISVLSWRLFRNLQKQSRDLQNNIFRQIESLSGLYGTLDIQHPLPRTRATAASPDFLHLLASEIFRCQPQLIVEVGSGTSTLIAAYCLKKMGRGKILSLDHLEQYANITRQTIHSHDLENFAEVHFAPLRSYETEGDKSCWYDREVLDGVEGIDMLIVDGPPQDVAERARYPAVPLLREKLHRDTVVLVDDGDREDESRIVSLWKEKYGLDFSRHATEKGAFVCNFDAND